LSKFFMYGVRYDVRPYTFPRGCPVLPTSFVGKTVLCLFDGLGTIVINPLTIYASICFCALSCILLVCLSVFMPIIHCSDYCSFIESFEIRMFDSCSFVLFQDCLGYQDHLQLHMNFRIDFSVSA
jgi:hypothetical protein